MQRDDVNPPAHQATNLPNPGIGGWLFVLCGLLAAPLFTAFGTYSLATLIGPVVPTVDHTRRVGPAPFEDDAHPPTDR